MQRLYSILKQAGLTALFLALASLASELSLRAQWQESSIVLFYLLAVFLSARYTGLMSTFLAILGSILLYNWLFIYPVGSLSIANPSYLITLAVFFTIALITASLSREWKRQIQIAKEEKAHTELLYHLLERTSQARTMEELFSALLPVLGDFLQSPCALFTVSKLGEIAPQYLQLRADGTLHHRQGRAPIQNPREASVPAPWKDPDGSREYWPISVSGEPRALLRVPSSAVSQSRQPEHWQTLLHTIAQALSNLESKQRQQLLEARARRERERSQWLRSISHDLRSPLTVILSYAEYLQGLPESGEDLRTVAAEIYAEARWLQRLVENVLQRTRLEAGEQRLRCDWESMEELLAAVVQRTGRLHPESCIRLSPPDGPLLVYMDAALMAQVFTNLLENAMDHAPATEAIELRAWEEGEWIYVEVLDQGPGIEPDDLEAIFDSFYTKRRCPENHRLGTGLGLAICRSIVEAHGGTIQARNREEGGACFWLRLPKKGLQQAEEASGSASLS